MSMVRADSAGTLQLLPTEEERLDRTLFVSVLVKIGTALGRPFDAIALGAYWDAVGEYENADFMAGARRFLKTVKFASPAALVEAIEAARTERFRVEGEQRQARERAERRQESATRAAELDRIKREVELFSTLPPPHDVEELTRRAKLIAEAEGERSIAYGLTFGKVQGTIEAVVVRDWYLHGFAKNPERYFTAAAGRPVRVEIQRPGEATA